jgi:two-component system, OmpR family, alkaline phosphatase synthesis response regulator PhoP
MSKRILVIDDEAHIVQVLLLKLRNAGYEVFTASDGEEGLDQALKVTPDLIITDFQMPYMTGLELAQALQRHEGLKQTPVLMLTARGYALSSEDWASVNIRNVLSKPFSPRAILEHIRAILEGDVSNDATRVQSESHRLNPGLIHDVKGKAA